MITKIVIIVISTVNTSAYRKGEKRYDERENIKLTLELALTHSLIRVTLRKYILSWAANFVVMSNANDASLLILSSSSSSSYLQGSGRKGKKGTMKEPQGEKTKSVKFPDVPQNDGPNKAEVQISVRMKRSQLRIFHIQKKREKEPSFTILRLFVCFCGLWLFSFVLLLLISFFREKKALIRNLYSSSSVMNSANDSPIMACEVSELIPIYYSIYIYIYTICVFYYIQLVILVGE